MVEVAAAKDVGTILSPHSPAVRKSSLKRQEGTSNLEVVAYPFV